MEHPMASIYVVLEEPSTAESKIILQQFEDLGVCQFRRFLKGAETLDSIFNDMFNVVISSLPIEDMTGSN